MNKRIKELAEQAQDWADAHAPYASEEHEYFVEKFAELIVQECIFISRTSTDGFSASRRMAERFGVEE